MNEAVRGDADGVIPVTNACDRPGDLAPLCCEAQPLNANAITNIAPTDRTDRTRVVIQPIYARASGPSQAHATFPTPRSQPPGQHGHFRSQRDITEPDQKVSTEWPCARDRLLAWARTITASLLQRSDAGASDRPMRAGANVVSGHRPRPCDQLLHRTGREAQDPHPAPSFESGRVPLCKESDLRVVTDGSMILPAVWRKSHHHNPEDAQADLPPLADPRERGICFVARCFGGVRGRS